MTDDNDNQLPSLDSNHNHFLLVDDGSRYEYGKEIEFRVNLEDELRKGKSIFYYRKYFTERKKVCNNLNESQSKDICKNDLSESIPMILIVVQGGMGTLIRVVNYLKRNMPILVLSGTNGCADLIANLYLVETIRY